MSDTFGAHVVETMRAQAFIDRALSTAGLSWGDPAKREAFVAALPFRGCGDSEADAQDMAGSQSCCGTITMGDLQACGFDGTVVRFRGRPVCNPLREPYAGHYDNTAYLETLGQQRGILQRPTRDERPDIRPGSVCEIGGPGLGGAVHIVRVVGVRADGTLDTVEGGKTDPKNPKPSPKNCTLIAQDHRELYQRPDGSWWMRDAGSTGLGRALRWWWWTGDLRMEGES